MHPTQTLPANAADPSTRRFDGLPETDADRRFFELRESGYLGWIDQDGHPLTDDEAKERSRQWSIDWARAARPVDPVTTATTLRAAAGYLDRHGWCQGSYYDQTATCFTPAACLVGALGMACYGGPVDAPALNFNDPAFDDFNAAISYLDRHFADVYDTDVYTFNDTRGRTVTDVTAVLRIAANEWDRTRGGVA